MLLAELHHNSYFEFFISYITQFMPLGLVIGELLFSFCDGKFPLFFMFFVVLCCCFQHLIEQTPKSLLFAFRWGILFVFLSHEVFCLYTGKPALLYSLPLVARLFSFHVSGSYKSPSQLLETSFLFPESGVIDQLCAFSLAHRP